MTIVSSLENRNIYLAGRKTSIKLEPAFWSALAEICLREGSDANDLVQKIDQSRMIGGRTSAVRTYILNYFRSAAAGTAPHIA